MLSIQSLNAAALALITHDVVTTADDTMARPTPCGGLPSVGWQGQWCGRQSARTASNRNTAIRPASASTSSGVPWRTRPERFKKPIPTGTSIG